LVEVMRGFGAGNETGMGPLRAEQGMDGREGGLLGLEQFSS
jgi:hypothetical protein